jgi:prophage regulatory protein
VRLLQLREVKAKTSLGGSTIYRYIAARTFPAPLQVSPGTVRWLEDEVDDWIRSLPRTVEDAPTEAGTNAGT